MTPQEARANAARRAAEARSQQGQVVATTKDGGRIMRAQDGTMSFTSPGYSTNDPAAIERLMEGATPIQEAQRTTDELTVRQNPVAARAQEFVQGTPFIGEYADEAVGLVSPTARDAMRQTSDAMERRYPGQSAALNVAGGVTTTLPLVAAGAGSKAVDFVTRGASPLTRALRAGGAGVVAGGSEGAISFAGRGETPEERWRGAQTGALVGGGLGGALSVLAPLMGAGATNLARRIKRLDVTTIADEFGLSQPAARVVKRFLANDDLDRAAAYLSRAGDDAMLAEAGPSTRQALDTAMSTGEGALAVARGRVDDRVAGAAARWQSTLDDVLGGADGGIRGASRDISRGTAAARKAAYDFAYSQPTPMAGKAGQELETILARIDPRDFDAAMREASAEARDAGIRNMNIMASIDDAGNVVFSQPPSVMELDYLARGLSNLVEKGTDSLTRQASPEARRAAGQVRALRDFLKTNVDGYERALNLGGDKIRRTDALVMGRKLLSETTTVEDVREAMRGATPDVRAAAKTGLRENIDALMGRARTTIADLEAGNLDFNTGLNQVAEAVAAIRNLTTRNNVVKMRMVLGSDANKLMRELERVGDALVLRSAVARNTATAIRQAGQEAMRNEVAPSALRQTAGNLGTPLEAARPITQAIAGTDARSISAQQAEYFTEIADALTRIRGPEAQRALAAVRRALAGQPMKDEEARLIGRLVGSSVGVGGLQAGTQPLAPR